MQCAICNCDLYSTNVKRYFCRKCFNEHKDDILAHAPWVTFLINDTARQRYREKRDLGKLVYLGSEYDLSEDGKLLKIHDEVN